MVSVIQEERQDNRQRRQLIRQQHRYSYYLKLGSSAYSFIVLAIRSSQTKQIPPEILDIFLILLKSQPRRRHLLSTGYIALNL
jgi:hypothetical protein